MSKHKAHQKYICGFLWHFAECKWWMNELPTHTHTHTNRKKVIKVLSTCGYNFSCLFGLDDEEEWIFIYYKRMTFA